MRPFDWTHLFRPLISPWEIAFRAAFIYLFVQAAVRLLGRKRLGNFAIRDIVFLFMLSPALRQTMVGDDTSLTTAMVAVGTLAVVDVALTHLVHRSPLARSLLEGDVRPLVRDGRIDEDQMRRGRVTREDLLAAVRQHGRSSLDDVEAAYLERSGQISIIFGARRDP